MSRVDTTSFANLLMGGLRTGINLGESANQQAFQQQQFNANEQQRGFANSLALEGRDMQRMQIIQQAEERVAKREELENKRKATTELMRLAGNPNAQYNPSDPRFAKWLEAVDRETQDHFYSAGNNRDRLNRRKALADSRKASGYKFSLREANDYEKDGIFIEDQYLLPTAKNERQQQDENDKNGYLALMVDRFNLPQETAQKWLGKSAKFVSDRYNELKTAAEAVAKQQAEAQAAALNDNAEVDRVNAWAKAQVARGVPVADVNAAIAGHKRGTELPMLSVAKQGTNPMPEIVNGNIQKATNDLEYWRKQLIDQGVLVKTPEGGLEPNTKKLQEENEKNLQGGRGSTPLNEMYARYKSANARVQSFMGDANRYAAQPAQEQQQQQVPPEYSNALELRKMFVAQHGKNPTPQELQALLDAQAQESGRGPRALE